MVSEITRKIQKIQLERFIRKLEKMNLDEEFKIMLLGRLNSIDYKEIAWLKHGLEFANEEKTISIVLTDTDVNYTVKYKNELDEEREEKAHYHKQPSGAYFTKYTTSTTTIFPNIYQGKTDNLHDSHNIDIIQTIHCFDKNGIEKFMYEETTKDNYFLNKKTHEKELHEPNCFENYVEKESTFRAKDKIIRKTTKIFKYPEDGEFIRNEDFYLVGKNVNPTSKKLPLGGEFIFFPKELFTEYKVGSCDIDTIWKNRGKTKVMK